MIQVNRMIIGVPLLQSQCMIEKDEAKRYESNNQMERWKSKE